MAKPHDITGQRFGSLVAVEIAYRDNWHSYWSCQCDCGRQHIVTMNNLRRGKTKSCGCEHRQRLSAANRTHGRSGTRLFGIWSAMKRRCSNPNVPEFKNYGGRGISVCAQWQESFANFLDDMGEPPPGLTLDRINNDGNYEHGNCRWADRLTQANNTRRNSRK